MNINNFFEKDELDLGDNRKVPLPDKPDEFERFPRRGDALAERLYDAERERKRRSRYLSRFLSSRITLAVPFKRIMRMFTPDYEASSLARLPRGNIGLARIALTKYTFPRSEFLRVKDLFVTDVKDVKKPKVRYSFYRNKIFADGSYYGLRGTIAYGARGQYVTHTRRREHSGGIAIVPTIISSINNHPHSRRVTRYDIVYKLMAGKRRLLLLVVFDCSESMKPYTIILVRALMMFHKIAWKMRNLVGLISVYGSRSTVLVYPTTNINKLIGGVFKLEFGGKTPLADGLLRAYRLISSMKIKYPDIIPRILLFSDGIANVELKRPIDNYYRERLLSPAQADVLSVGKLLSTKDIKVIVVNPWHIKKWPGKVLISPTNLLINLAKMTGGIYLGFNLESLQEFQGFTRYSTSIKTETLTGIAESIVDAIFESLLSLNP